MLDHFPMFSSMRRWSWHLTLRACLSASLAVRVTIMNDEAVEMGIVWPCAILATKASSPLHLKVCFSGKASRLQCSVETCPPSPET
jgi:hypothetical protein